MNTNDLFRYTCYVVMFLFLIEHVTAISDMQKTKIQSELVSVGLQCIKDYPLTLTDIRDFKNKMIPNGKNPKCFAACLFKKIGVMDNMGKLSPSSAREHAMKVFKDDDEHLKNVDGIMDKCSSVNQQNTMDGNKGCDRAKLAFGCFTENAPKFGFNFDF